MGGIFLSFQSPAMATKLPAKGRKDKRKPWLEVAALLRRRTPGCNRLKFKTYLRMILLDDWFPADIFSAYWLQGSDPQWRKEFEHERTKTDPT
jgi:hypothetical protein